MALCKNHDFIYFDTLRRTNKAETVLSLIQASYHVKTSEEEKLMYDITNQDGIVWVNHIDVGNTVYVKRGVWYENSSIIWYTW